MAMPGDDPSLNKGPPETNSTDGGNGKLVKQPPPHHLHDAVSKLQNLNPAQAEDSQRKALPPTKRDLTSWWKQFKKNSTKKEEEKKPDLPGIFGVPLGVSIKYANVAISLLNDEGESFIYGYVPIVVAKCGVYLKENATETEGIFRLSGSARRIKDLQGIFDSPDRYGKGLDWSGYTVHDGANILRRYLNQLPEPIVPLECYERFRDPLRSVQAQAAETNELQTLDARGFDHDAAVLAYQKLITELPPLNRQLLLYILDLLAVFASKSELNKMNSANLSAIFQPGLISHPSHDMAPAEYKLSQYVLIFLIENQDNFLIGMSGTAADEKTVKEVQSGAIPISVPKTTTLGRSASNASAGADSLRKYGGVRRNLSTSSRTSKASGSNQAPSTPNSGVGFSGASSGGLGRSNTVPSKKSPGLASARFPRPSEPSTPNSATLTPQAAYSRTNTGPTSPLASSTNVTPAPTSSTPQLMSSETPDSLTPIAAPLPAHANLDRIERVDRASPSPSPKLGPTTTPAKERKISGLFGKSPSSDAEKKDLKPPNKLRKKRIGSGISSAQSSTHSLGLPDGYISPAYTTPLVSPEIGRSNPMDSIPLSVNPATPQTIEEDPMAAKFEPAAQYPSGTSTLRPRAKSPAPSNHSRSSVTDHSDFDLNDTPNGRAEKSRRRWRFSHQGKENPEMGTHAMAQYSTSSVGSSSRPRKSFTNDSQQIGTDVSSNSAGVPALPNAGTDLKDNSMEPERKGIFGKLKAKMTQSRDRAKSPPRSDNEGGKSKQSLNAIIAEGVTSPEKPTAGAEGPSEATADAHPTTT